MNINNIIKEEIIIIISELLDINNGGSYYPPGLDPSVVKLFEEILNITE